MAVEMTPKTTESAHADPQEPVWIYSPGQVEPALAVREATLHGSLPAQLRFVDLLRAGSGEQFVLEDSADVPFGDSPSTGSRTLYRLLPDGATVPGQS